MHADKIFQSILNEIPRTMGWMKEVEVPIVEDWIVPTQDDYLRAYFKESDILIVEYKGKYLEVPCNIDSDDTTIARKIMGAFAQIVLKKAGKEKNNIKINENRKMKRTIRLNETQLRKIVKESVKRVLGEQKRVLREFGYDNKRDDLIGIDLHDAIRQAESEGWKWNPRSEKRNGKTLETTLYAGDKMDTGGYGSAYLYIVSKGDDTDGTFIVEYACETFN